MKKLGSLQKQDKTFFTGCFKGVDVEVKLNDKREKDTQPNFRIYWKDGTECGVLWKRTKKDDSSYVYLTGECSDIKIVVFKNKQSEGYGIYLSEDRNE